MSLPEYVATLRRAVGHAPLLLPSVTVLIFDGRRRILLVRPAGHTSWVAPGGIIDQGESPADAARREAWEETGLDVELTSLQGVYAGPDFRVVYPNQDVVDYVMVVYQARARTGTPQPRDSEVAELRYVARRQVAEVPLARWARLVVHAAFAPRSERMHLSSTWSPPATVT